MIDDFILPQTRPVARQGKKRQAQVKAASYPLEIALTLVCRIPVSFRGTFRYMDTCTTSGALKASRFRTITDRNIPAIKHGEPIETPPI
jgi:hypothetical protein